MLCPTSSGTLEGRYFVEHYSPYFLYGGVQKSPLDIMWSTLGEDSQGTDYGDMVLVDDLELDVHVEPFSRLAVA